MQDREYITINNNSEYEINVKKTGSGWYVAFVYHYKNVDRRSIYYLIRDIELDDVYIDRVCYVRFLKSGYFESEREARELIYKYRKKINDVAYIPKKPFLSIKEFML